MIETHVCVSIKYGFSNYTDRYMSIRNSVRGLHINAQLLWDLRLFLGELFVQVYTYKGMYIYACLYEVIHINKEITDRYMNVSKDA